jgi:hypothetical protein
VHLHDENIEVLVDLLAPNFERPSERRGVLTNQSVVVDPLVVLGVLPRDLGVTTGEVVPGGMV